LKRGRGGPRWWPWVAVPGLSLLFLRCSRPIEPERELPAQAPIQASPRPERVQGHVDPVSLSGASLEWWGDSGRGPEVLERWKPDHHGKFQGKTPASATSGLVLRRYGRVVGWVPHYALGRAEPLRVGGDAGVRVVVPLQTPNGPGANLRFRVSLMLHGVGWIPFDLGRDALAKSSPDGQLVLNGIPRGASLSLELQGDEYANAPRLSMFGAGRDDERRLAPVSLERAATIVGRLLDANGKPAAGARVRLRRVASFLDDARSVADSDGTFRFVGIRPGAYGVVPLPWRGDSRTFAASIVEPVRVSPGERIRLGTLIGESAGLLTGRAVSGRDGTGSAGVVVRAAGERGSTAWTNEAVTDRSGRFDLWVAPGRYRVVGSRFDAFLGEVSRIRIQPNEVEVAPREHIALKVVVGNSNRTGR